MSNQQEYRRTTPQSDLDLAFMTTDSVWGKPEIAQELKQRLNKQFITHDVDGKQGYTVESMWGLLGFYTRDMRLANLSQFNGEVNYCQYYLDLANDFLQSGFIEPFLISLSRVATMLELSQSKGGFLRRNSNTLRTENMHGEMEPPKKNLFGGNKPKQ